MEEMFMRKIAPVFLGTLMVMLIASRVFAEPLARVILSEKSVEGATLLEFDKALFTKISKSTSETKVELPLPDGTMGAALLYGRTIPLFTEDAVIIVQGDGEPVIRKPPTVETVLGTLAGEDRSAVALTRIGDRYFGFVTRATGATLSVTPAGEEFGKSAHQITSLAGELELPSQFCDVQIPPGATEPKEPVGTAKGGVDLKPIQIAAEGSYELYKFLGFDEIRAEEYTTQLMAAVSSIFEVQLGASLQLVGIRQWVTYRDPYFNSSLTVLETERDMVANNQVPPQFANADLIHVVSTFRNRGGIAYLGVLDFCGDVAREYRVGFSDIYASTTFPTSSYSWDINVVAHELGHNVGSPHTHCYDPPIDFCYTSESGCATGPVVPQEGTIMSYCHLVASVRLEFSQREVDLMRNSLDASSCLPGPVSVSPNPPLPDQPVTVTYDPAGGPLAQAPTVFVRRGSNNWGNGQVTDAAMTRNGAVWEYTYQAPADAYSLHYYFRNLAGNVGDDNDGYHWRFATDQGFVPLPTPLPDRVIIEPDPPLTGRQALISYKAGGTPLNTSAAVFIHRGLSGWQTVLGNAPMTFDEATASWQYRWEIPEDATSIEFVFTDGESNWDNNNGDDWHFRTVDPTYTSSNWTIL